MTDSSTCFHCKGPLACCARDVETFAGVERVCSDTCETALRSINAFGLTDFYRHRAAPAQASTRGGRARVDDWHTYERPAVMREFVRDEQDGTRTADLLIQGVHCAACTWLIENALSKISGVVSVEVNPVTTRAQLRWNPAIKGLAELMQTIAELGYEPVPFTEQESYRAAEQERRLAMRRLLVAGLGMMQVASYAVAMYAGAFQGMDPAILEFLRLVSLVVATPVVLYAGAPFFAGAWRNLRGGHMGMDVPVALATGTAWAASVWNTFNGSGEVYFDSATMFVFFLSGTRYLEAAGRHRALDLTHALAQHIPCTALRVTTSGTEEVGVLELNPGDLVQVAPGNAFPADGVLEDCRTHVDESMLTGESVPVAREPGDTVVAGTVNLSAMARVRIASTGPDTVLAQIGRLVMQAGAAKPELVQLTDRIATVFVTVVLLIAAATGLTWQYLDPDRVFEIVLTVLVITCPCALALATPAAFTVATSALARTGFLVRKGDALPRLARVTTMVFDKTGTLTDNSIAIGRIQVFGEHDEQAALAVAAALEAHSAHPIARAFREVRSELACRQASAVAGAGLEGTVAGRAYRIGTADFAAALSGRTVPQVSADRLVWLGDRDGLLACFTLHEKLREGAGELFGQLGGLDIRAVIASGDQETAVEKLAAQLDAAEWHSRMLPQDKLSLVRKMQGHGEIVAAIGDGVNDSPLLAGADVSIAMGSGTSIAQHSADCVWLGTRLAGLDSAFRLARQTMRIVRQNLCWALAYNLLAIPLAISGSLQPWMAALGMSLSSLIVMLNALRLSRTRLKPAAEPAPLANRSQPELAT